MLVFVAARLEPELRSRVVLRCWFESGYLEVVAMRIARNDGVGERMD